MPFRETRWVLAALKVKRPKQWAKNGLLAAALVFSGQFFDPQRSGRAALAVMAFNLLSSSGYVLNDYLDRKAVMSLAACYVWRAIAGAVAIAVRVSPWFFLCTAFFALFLGFAKRKAELVQVGNVGTRKNLREYTS